MDFPAWLPLVSDGRVAVSGDKLRHWGISETWRIRWADGPATIVKRGAGEEADGRGRRPIPLLDGGDHRYLGTDVRDAGLVGEPTDRIIAAYADE